jgi:hypothetical protein
MITNHPRRVAILSLPAGVVSLEPDSVCQVSSFKVSVGTSTVRVKNFRDARSVVARAITDLTAQDPEAMARSAVVLNEAFDSGAAEHSLTAHHSWSTTVTIDGEQVPIAIRKHWW